jgi:3-phosphoshikimate 1-carboxyvinyltransferase
LIDVGHAGTTMRFLTSFFSISKKSKKILTGSPRMLERPIKILVDALIELGAKIDYKKKQGYPPLIINGRNILGGSIELSSEISSQYISSLLLIAPKLKNGLELFLKGNITSLPYIEMTCNLLKKIGVGVDFDGSKIKVFPKNEIRPVTIDVESDWSSASYYYSIIALAKKGKVVLSTFNNNSLQGDNIIAKIYDDFGVKTTFLNKKIILEKTSKVKKHIDLDLIKSPDLAQTIVVSCYGLGISCNLSGLHTLKIKETDRLLALYNELKKIGAKVEITENSIFLNERTNEINENVPIETYNDHRMAMAFAPLALISNLKIKYPSVVSKSYPYFWNDLSKLGFKIFFQ